mgnify:CR=1 FL=1
MRTPTQSLRVGVIRGGIGDEYEVSLSTGGSVLKHLPERHKSHDILITRDGVWHWQGLPIEPKQLAGRVDLIFNALHGEYGEDGQVQGVLDEAGLPYTGAGRVPAKLAMDKSAAKQIFAREGLFVAPGMIIEPDEEPVAAAKRVFLAISPFWIVKPLNGGSSVGVAVARTLSELAQAIATSRQSATRLLVERLISGREATCGVVDDFRGREHYALPPIEIRRPSGKSFWDYQDKYSGATSEICPGNFSAEEKGMIEEAAVVAHKALGLRHYSRTDFILTPKRIYVLETNALPGLTSESLLPKAIAAVGCPYPQFLDHILALTVENR